MAHVRTFIALELPEAVQVLLAQVTARLAGLGKEVRWVRPEGAHVTLKFLGDVDEARVPDLVRAVQVDAAEGNPLKLHTAHLGGFPSLNAARVVWLGVGGDMAGLLALQARVEAAMETLGFAKEQRKFFPHITLGRARRRPVRVNVGLADGLQMVPFQVGRVVLMQSQLQPEGAIYLPLGYGLLLDSK